MLFFFLDNFLSNLEKNEFIDNINLTILSDHGSRITREDNSFYSDPHKLVGKWDKM